MSASTPVQAEGLLNLTVQSAHYLARDPHRTQREQIRELRILVDNAYLSGMRFAGKRAERFGLKVGIPIGVFLGFFLGSLVMALS
jgi:hypothetical protein